MTVKELINKLGRLNPNDEVVAQKCQADGTIQTDAVYGHSNNHEIVSVASGQQESVVILGIGDTKGGWRPKV